MPYITPDRQKRFQDAVDWVRHMIQSNGITTGNEAPQDNIISMLRSVQRNGPEKLSDEEVVQEVMTIGGAGHETTANTVRMNASLVSINL